MSSGGGARGRCARRCEAGRVMASRPVSVVVSAKCRTRLRTPVPPGDENVGITENASAAQARPLKETEIQMFPHSRSRISPLKLASVTAIATTALAAAPTALAATSGGVPATPAAAHSTVSPRFTMGLSATTVKPGASLTVSGLAYARAGLNVTIMSDAIASAQVIGGVPAIQTPALVEGIYRTTVRVPPATKPGVYAVVLRFGNRQVAAIHNLRVVTPGSPTGGPTGRYACAGIGFTVLHNDHAGTAYLPAGGYKVSSRNMDCGTASVDFTRFLSGAGRPIAGWSTTSPGAGRATFTERNGGLSFSVAKGR